MKADSLRNVLAVALAASVLGMGPAAPVEGLGTVIGPAAAFAQETPLPRSPADIYGDLFAQVQLRRLFPDSKTFADAVPRAAPETILAAYSEHAAWTDAALRQFVLDHFSIPGADANPVPLRLPSLAIADHIDRLWPMLTRDTRTAPAGGSALALPKPYVVPGGRFRELYYWDSYFTMLGLAAGGREDLVEGMIDDFGDLIDRFGHIPNGTRSYYLSRSQPPFFYAMVGLSKASDHETLSRRLQWMRKEHAFWMSGEAGLKPGEARRRVVALPGGAILNRYFDDRDTPRDESYAEDVALAKASDRPAAEVYRDLRAAAESGWDFSSRWLEDGKTLASIHTTDLAPVDLNSLLYGLERAIEHSCAQLGDAACASEFGGRARARATAMQALLWDAGEGAYRDYDWRAGRQTTEVSAATLYPLFTGLAPTQAGAPLAAFVRAHLLAPGGLRTTSLATGQQWDLPNGWAPLQWIAVRGLDAYGQRALADEIAGRWVKTVEREYAASGKLLEKYDLETIRPGGGGEYPLQDGFGWTNGVTRTLLQRGDKPDRRQAAKPSRAMASIP